MSQPTNRGKVRIILPNGDQVFGWVAAVTQLQVSPLNLKMRSDWDDEEQAWRIRAPRRARKSQ